MKILVNISRILVGVLFIFSGFVKLNDPLGFSYKLIDYFAPDVLNLEFLIPYALPLAIFLVIFEVVLGVTLLIGFRVKFTVWSLLLMIVFFTFLTFYSAYFNKVTDCGCFGDAIPLTPWQSFIKDIILLVFILILFFYQESIKPITSEKINTVITIMVTVLCGWFGYHVLHHLPSLDFRPYKVGANITEGMSVPEGAPKAVFEYRWKFKVNGEEKIITTNGDYPSVDGEFVDVETEQIAEGYQPPIHDFTIEKDGEDFTQEFLGAEKLVMIIAYNVSSSSAEGWELIQPITERALKKGYKVIGLTASIQADAELYKKEFDLNFEFYTCDETALKTIVRSNPGILKLNKGTVIQKLHFNDADDLNL
ncbi:BT_3928 family protein [Sungkyunkwania multivorans]|uniref:BT_3928 family protein n=1 Tax=Sungkyunkwania multivorans TaxID=1173618 RepID=A0ABW3CWX4_9FLAO